MWIETHTPMDRGQKRYRHRKRVGHTGRDADRERDHRERKADKGQEVLSFPCRMERKRPQNLFLERPLGLRGTGSMWPSGKWGPRPGRVARGNAAGACCAGVSPKDGNPLQAWGRSHQVARLAGKQGR